MNIIKKILFVIMALWYAGSSAGTAEQPSCVGYASVDKAGVIQLNLVSSEPTHGGAMLLLDKSHPLYQEMRKHIGKVKVGHWKCLKSMPELESTGEAVKNSQAIVPKR